MAPNTNLDIIFGAMTFGKEGLHGVRTYNLDECRAILDIFKLHGHTEIDTSRVYGSGTSEEYLGVLKWQDLGLVVHTKFYANVAGYFGQPVQHLTMPDMRKELDISLTTLKTDSVDLWYLHAPDRSVELYETVKAVQDLYKEGKFKRWGISNYMAWEVAAICEMCNANEGWVKPSVYQGLYNSIHRTVEHELLPCLRKYGISFYAFNPLAGGWLTDRYHRDTENSSLDVGSRFEESKMQGKMYRARYWNEANFQALDIIREVLKGTGLRESEVALRWMMNHSQLKKELGDKVIIGASSKAQLEMNLEDFEKGELNAEVLEAFDKAWNVTKGGAWKYFH